jgi:hypothetical protein
VVHSNAQILTIVAILAAGAAGLSAQAGVVDDACHPHEPARRETSQSDGNAQPSSIGQASSSRRIEGTLVVGDVNVGTLRLALSALPRRPTRIVIVGNAAMPADVAGRVRDLDGFVPVGSGTIYLRRESVTLREAEVSGGPYTLMLAAVIWHELAHVNGCDEAQARDSETRLWQEFVRSGRVDSALGLTYLAELLHRK